MSITRAVLFDLDGTLADTAPDLGGALNRLLVERGRAAVPLEHSRPHTSSGARGMIGAGFGITPEHPEYEALKERFLQLYAQGLCIATQLFDGMHELLDEIESRGLAWGIVTNKAARFTVPLVNALGLATRARCIVSGDTTPRAKPHPDPLLHAATLIAVPPAQCLYIGDDLRDVRAAHAANMRAVAVRFGYLGSEGPPETWGADGIADTPADILRFVHA
jgi:N-acetyl-D-muramate 6-phosphate phosphatase